MNGRRGRKKNPAPTSSINVSLTCLIPSSMRMWLNHSKNSMLRNKWWNGENKRFQKEFQCCHVSKNCSKCDWLRWNSESANAGSLLKYGSVWSTEAPPRTSHLYNGRLMRCSIGHTWQTSFTCCSRCAFLIECITLTCCLLLLFMNY